MARSTTSTHTLKLTHDSIGRDVLVNDLPTFLRPVFGLGVNIPVVVIIEGDAKKFWDLSGYIGQLENIARCANQSEAANRLEAFRGALNASANAALEGR